MTAILANQDLMTDTATYWPRATNDGYGGLTFGASSSITCRWEDVAEKSIDIDGNEFTSAAVVYPDQICVVGGWLFEGTSTESDPRDEEGAREIRSFRKIKSLTGSYVEYKAVL